MHLRLANFLLLAAALFVSVACSSIPPAAVVEERIRTLEEERKVDMVLLEFSGNGRVTEEGALARLAGLMEQHRNSARYKRAVVLSYGWNYHLAEATYSYLESLEKYYDNVEGKPPAPGGTSPDTDRTLIICIRWDSKFSLVEDLLGAVLPFPNVTGPVGQVVDNIAFPVSFWQSARAADRIGGSGLSVVLETMFETQSAEGTADDVPLYLVGHSFGGRLVLSSLVTAQTNGLSFLKRIRGAVLLQPAAHETQLARFNPTFPAVATYNRHDRATSVLYPLANAVANTDFAPSAWSGVRATATSTAELLTKSEPAPAVPEEPTSSPGDLEVIAEQDVFDDVSQLAFAGVGPIGSAVLDGSQAGLRDVSLVYYGTSYLGTLAGAVKHPESSFTATLTSLPVAGWYLQKAGACVFGNKRWGRKRSGWISGGFFVHSAAAPALTNEAPSMPLEDFMGAALRPGWSRVDIADASYRSWIGGWDMRSWWFSTFLGWWDPKGAHSDYNNPQLHKLIAKITTS